MPGPYARKLTAKLRSLLRQKVVDLQALSAGRLAADTLQKTVASRAELADMDPAHAVYVYVQNQVSVFCELLTALPELERLTDILAGAEDEYMPLGPPTSPLTASHFWSWAFFDASVGVERETIGTCVLALAEVVPMHAEFLRLVRLAQDSRLGVYVHEGHEGRHVRLRELVTEQRCTALVPAGYRGAPGQLWLARVLPPPFPGSDVHIVFTTPYVLRNPGEAPWTAYFDRTLPKVDPGDRHAAYAALMKRGLRNDPNFWNEYIFEAYDDHQHDAVFLTGLPDVDASRPFSRVNR
ncbi:MAG: hypothetical protein JXB32_22245 [Deltaproteobacteria bacterium]|nr:hypothetical protein [Deltaproteobacteria bacterium]